MKPPRHLPRKSGLPGLRDKSADLGKPEIR